MEVSRSSTPEAPPQDLWSSILDSVSTSRSIPSKQILLLGQPSSGKSTLAAALLHKPLPGENKDKDDTKSSDFALGYDWADVRDDADEDTLARLSVYTVPSPEVSYTNLLPHFLPPRSSLPHTIVMIALDWTQPWKFVEELETWLHWVENWAKGDGSRELEIAREENRERLQAYLQHYTEPSTDPIPPTSNLSDSTLLPLGPGTFTHNASGVPIVITCTKADLIDEGNDLVAGASGMGGMVKGKGGDWEERTDGIMQILRTICLKYGAGLFYTTPLSSTVQVLRQYALHLLFIPPALSPAGLSSATDAPIPLKNPFPFLHKPNTLDRDRIVVPAGWDSWGKIAVLRDGFEAKVWGEAWERDLELDESLVGDEPGAKKLFSSLVPDQGAKAPPLPPITNPTPEQAFLAKNFYENSKKTNQDPRNAFRSPTENAAAGIVGPLGSSSFNLPAVERALTDMEAGMGGGASSGVNLGASVSANATDRKPSSRTRPSLSTAGGAPVTSSTHLGRPTSAISPTADSASPTAGGKTQHEVLQNFFNRLLSNKDRASAGAATAQPRTSPPRANGTGEEEGSS